MLGTLMLISQDSVAQIDTINLKTNDLVVANLKPGKYQYLVTFGNAKKKKFTGSSVWSREVKFETINGQEAIVIEQQWYMSDTTFNRQVYSVSRKKDFSSVFHKTKGKGGIEAFNFTGSKIVGADSVANNVKFDTNVDANYSTLNWELDLEVFSILPYKKEGQRFIISFYHPGGKTPPKYYEYAVVGSEKIEIAGEKPADCWMLKIDYSPTSSATFWISKKTHEVLKMQETFGSGFRYKIKFSTPVNLVGL